MQANIFIGVVIPASKAYGFRQVPSQVYRNSGPGHAATWSRKRGGGIRFGEMERDSLPLTVPISPSGSPSELLDKASLGVPKLRLNAVTDIHEGVNVWA